MSLTEADIITLVIGLIVLLALAAVAVVLAYFVLRNHFCPPSEPPPPHTETPAPNTNRPPPAAGKVYHVPTSMPEISPVNPNSGMAQQIMAQPGYTTPSYPPAYSTTPRTPTYPGPTYHQQQNNNTGYQAYQPPPTQRWYITTAARPADDQVSVTDQRRHFTVPSPGINPAYQPDDVKGTEAGNGQSRQIPNRGYYGGSQRSLPGAGNTDGVQMTVPGQQPYLTAASTGGKTGDAKDTAAGQELNQQISKRGYFTGSQRSLSSTGNSDSMQMSLPAHQGYFSANPAYNTGHVKDVTAGQEQNQQIPKRGYYTASPRNLSRANSEEVQISLPNQQMYFTGNTAGQNPAYQHDAKDTDV